MRCWVLSVGFWMLFGSILYAQDTPVTAADFRFITPDGVEQTLYQTNTDRRTLVVFYDSSCDRCEYIIYRLEHSSVLNHCLEQQELAVLAVDVGGSETLWKERRDGLPDGWLKAFDRSSLYDHDWYNFDELPVLYLLDKDKHILLETVDVYLLTSFISNPTPTASVTPMALASKSFHSPLRVVVQ